MKLDMHFHTKEGSIDGKVSIEEGLSILKEKGYDGVLITDHNSYEGYNSLKNSYGLTVLCGLEYDTCDAGHVIIILPNSLQSSIFTIPGLEISEVLKIVHNLGGVCGLPHPFDCSRLGFMNRHCKEKENILKEIDFIEGCNSASFENKNKKAKMLAKRLKKPCVAGSDSHSQKEVGIAEMFTEKEITSNDDLINLIKSGDYNTFEISDKNRKSSLFNWFFQLRLNFGGLFWFPFYFKTYKWVHKFV